VALVHFLTSPYVFAIFLILPPAARQSTVALKKWLKQIPPSTEIAFQIPGGIVGVPVNRTYAIGNLRSLPPRLGRIANFSTTDARRQLLNSGKQFYVRHGAKPGEETVKWRTIWPDIAKTITGQSKWN
jgi:hypothetical protein